MLRRWSEDGSISATAQIAQGRQRVPAHEAAAPFARVDVFDNVAAAAGLWSSLQASVRCTPYQTLAWSEAWCATAGTARGQTPLIVVASDESGRPVALLPLLRGRVAGITMGRFIGGKDSNANFGLFAEPSRWDAASVRRLLHDAAAATKIDLFAFRHQPMTWQGAPNPLLLLPHQQSPSGSWSGALTADPDRTLTIRLSKHARKLLRQKETRLAQTGPVEHRRAVTRDEVEAVVQAYVAQKGARAVATGMPPPSPGQVAFLRQAALPADAGAPVEWHALWCGTDPVATFAGTGHQQHFSGMVLAFDPDPAVAKCSPGEILIKHVMADLSRRGFTRFDLGVGDARYKATFCDTADSLYDSILGISVCGRAVSAVLVGLGRAKRRAKRSDLMSRMTARLRMWRTGVQRSVS